MLADDTLVLHFLVLHRFSASLLQTLWGYIQGTELGQVNYCYLKTDKQLRLLRSPIFHPDQ
jgi:hypothetical protein